MSKSEINKEVWKSWAELEQLGAANFTLELFELFLATSAENMSALNLAFEAKEPKRIIQYTRSLKGGCLQVGAMVLFQELDYLESLARRSSALISEDLFATIKERYARVQGEIAAECEVLRLKENGARPSGLSYDGS